MRAHTSLLTLYCPNKQCARRHDFINPPKTFKKLCVCQAVFQFDDGVLTLLSGPIP